MFPPWFWRSWRLNLGANSRHLRGMIRDQISQFASFMPVLLIGAAGAFAAWAAGLPMPFMLGALGAVGAVSMWRGREVARAPVALRKLFVAVIGVMIGASFSPDLLAQTPRFALSIAVMAAFVFAMHAISTVIYQRVGGFDRVTAVYAAMPGGLIDAVELGRQAGADAGLLSLCHFARVVLVIVFVPILFWVVSGEVVGSASGASFEVGPWSAIDVVDIVGVGVAGLFVGGWLRLPAGHLVGPMLLSALIHGLGLWETVSPDWLLYLAQLVVGTALGLNFATMSMADMRKGIGVVAITASVGLMAAAALGLLLEPLLPMGFEAIFLAFAPGGVAEMGLVALSLGISPMVVTIHHIFRIALTVAYASWITRDAPRTPGA